MNISHATLYECHQTTAKYSSSFQVFALMFFPFIPWCNLNGRYHTQHWRRTDSRYNQWHILTERFSFRSFIHLYICIYITVAKLMSWESNVLHHVYRCQSVFNLLSFFHIWIAVFHHLSFVFEKNLWNALENIFKLQHFLVNRFRIYFFLEKRYLA